MENCYHFATFPSTYREAKKYCEKTGGYLAEFDTEAEAKELEGHWRTFKDEEWCNTRSWWLGLSDADKEGTWVTERTKQPPSYTNWNGGTTYRYIPY